MRRNFVVLTTILTAFLLFIMQYCIYPQKAVPATRGVWMWGSTLGSADSKTIVEKLKDNYVNKVFLLVKGSNGSKTSSAVLTEFIADAHAAGIEVHFWYIVGDDYLYLVSHSDAHVYHSPKPGVNSNPYPNTDSKVNLLYPGYKEFVLDNIKYFLANFDCDGIHLDVIRYSHLVYSFDKYHIQKADSMGCNTQKILKLFNDNYSQYSGEGFINLYVSGDADVVKWVTMRKNVIYDYISSVRNLINTIKPGAKLTAAFMPEGATEPYMADVHYAQNYALNSPNLDEISTMAYFNSYGQPTSWLKLVAEEAVKRVSSNCIISNGYQTFDNVTADDVKNQILFSLAGGVTGVVNFRYATTTDEQWDVIKEQYKLIFESDKALVTNKQLQNICSEVCSAMNQTLSVPDSVVKDSSGTVVLSASALYYLMADYLRFFAANDSIPPASQAIFRNVAGPVNPKGTQAKNHLTISEILRFAKTDADHIDSVKVLPDYVNADSVKYNLPAIFWVYARTIEWFNKNKSMPDSVVIKECSGPSTWTYGDDVVSIDLPAREILPENYILNQNYPNPFNPSTIIEFEIAIPGYISLAVYDILGREVAVLFSGEISAGRHSFNFNASQFAGGVYFYRLVAGNKSYIKKMLYLK